MNNIKLRIKFNDLSAASGMNIRRIIKAYNNSKSSVSEEVNHKNIKEAYNQYRIAKNKSKIISLINVFIGVVQDSRFWN